MPRLPIEIVLWRELEPDERPKFIRSVRRQLDLTQTQAEELIGYCKGYVSQLERGDASLCRKAFMKVMRAYRAYERTPAPDESDEVNYAYVARCRKCSHVVAATMDTPRHAQNVAEDIACWVQDGMIVERVLADKVPELFASERCHCQEEPQP